MKSTFWISIAVFSFVNQLAPTCLYWFVKVIFRGCLGCYNIIFFGGKMLEVGNKNSGLNNQYHEKPTRRF